MGPDPKDLERNTQRATPVRSRSQQGCGGLGRFQTAPWAAACTGWTAYSSSSLLHVTGAGMEQAAWVGGPKPLVTW